MKNFFILLLCIAGSVAMAQTKIVSGEYWFNDNLGTRSELSGTQSSTFNLETEIEVSQLQDGLHTIHLRFLDDSARWGSVVSRFFVKTTINNVVTISSISQMQYWFDNFINSKTTVNTGDAGTFSFSQDIDVSNLADGLHTIHVRYLDNTGLWSPVVSRFFVLDENDTGSETAVLQKMEYWFNGEIAQKQSIDLGGDLFIALEDRLDVETLPYGLHTLHLRVMDSKGMWSPAASRFFVKQEHQIREQHQIVAMRYWTDHQNMMTVEFPDSAGTLLFDDSLDMRLTPKGERLVHMQFKDNSGLWSPAVTDTFEKISFPFAQLNFASYSGCAGDSMLLSALVVDADSVIWHFGSEALGTGLTLNTHFAETGTFPISVTLYDTTENISKSYAADSSLVIHPLPNLQLDDSLLVWNDEVKPINAGNEERSYLWNNQPGSNVFEVSQSSLGLGRHVMPVVVEDQYGCISSDTIIINIKSDVGINPASLLQLKLYPNPAHHHLTITWDDASKLQTSIALMDQAGKVLKLINNYRSGTPMDVSHLASGTYVVTIQMGKRVVAAPVIVVNSDW